MVEWADAHPWVVTGAIAIIAILISSSIGLYIFKKNFKTKTIDYVIENDIDLLSSHASDLNDLHVQFRGRTLSAPRIVTINFMNTGNTAITEDDYADSIRVFHGDSNNTLDAFVLEQSTNGIVDRVTAGSAGSESVDIKPKLFNPGEYFTVRFLFEGREPLSVRGRFKDQTRPMQDRTPSSGWPTAEQAEYRMNELGYGPLLKISTRMMLSLVRNFTPSPLVRRKSQN